MNRWAVITGASSGIGEATAQQFLDNNISVINLSRTPCTLPNVHNFSVDLSDLTSLEQCSVYLQKMISEDAVITLVHNAGIFLQSTVRNTTLEVWQQTLAVNLIAPSMLTQYLLPRMLPGSSILYIGSTLAEKAAPHCASYVASKHALIGLMRATMEDLAHTGIHTVAICPGFTDTAMLRHRVNNNALTLERFGKSNGMGRIASANEIARIVLFCADNPALNGTVMHANCGQLDK